MSVREELLALLRSAVDTYDGDAQGAEVGLNIPGYSVLYMMPRRVTSSTVGNVHDEFEWEFRVVSAGATEDHVEWVDERAQDALAGQRIAVEGYSLGPVETRSTSKPPRDEENPTTTVHYGSSSYVIRGSRA